MAVVDDVEVVEAPRIAALEGGRETGAEADTGAGVACSAEGAIGADPKGAVPPAAAEECVEANIEVAGLDLADETAG